MKNENYFVGLDIGTDSVGYAVTDEEYNLCKFKGEPMWGVTLFDEAQLASERRGYRVARRRLDRRQQRVLLVQELFAKEVCSLDEKFFFRIKESYRHSDNAEDKIRLFDTFEKQKEYINKYPTIHHLIVELMEDKTPHDARLVYLACAWLVAHRGHFLSEVDKHNVAAVIDFESVYERLVSHIKRDGYLLPWDENVDLGKVQSAIKSKLGVQKKSKALAEALFGTQKVPKTIDENCQYEYNYDLLLKLLCGGKVALSDLFGKDEYSELEEKSVALNMDDERLAAIMQSIGDDAELISVLKAIYDWSVLIDVLKGEDTVSKAKRSAFEQHKKDLKELKFFIRKYAPEKYADVFRAKNVKNNYASYIGKNKTQNNEEKIEKTKNKEDFCKYILSVLKNAVPEESDSEAFNKMIERLSVNDYLPKQVEGDNRVIPYQLYWHEMNVIIENAKAYLPFLSEKDDQGITVAEKLLLIFEFRVPYYVGPLRTNPDGNKKLNHWMVRKAEGKIYPWNFDKMVNLEESENAFIDRMTSSCTYLPGEDVLPKNSLIYCAFEVLNEINNIKINGNPITVELKQMIYNDLFMNSMKVTPKRIREYLKSNNYITDSDIMSGLDVSVKSSLKPFLYFKSLIKRELLSYADVEKIIKRSSCTEDKKRMRDWLAREFSSLDEKDIAYLSSLKLKDFGRLSRKLLCGIEGANTRTGEAYSSIIRAMWETNCNLMQLLSDQFDFKKKIDAIVLDYYDANQKTLPERLDEMGVSNSVKRPIIRTLDILKDVVKINGRAPERIFIEMARGASEDQRGKRTVTRKDQIFELYKKIRDEDVPELQNLLDNWGDEAHNKLQSDKIFLYFIQLGKCLYTGKHIDIESVIAGDGIYNIEHIYPKSFVKDDSIINNKILVDSKVNGDKKDSYPLDPLIQEKMIGFWRHLNQNGLLSDEKLKRLVRTTGFTEEEKYEFINRQLVETRQSTKAVATLLKEIYPDTDIVYVKAGLVSDFRQKFDFLKSRAVNDLHHAKDAYLNIAVGNVWYSKFNRQFWRATEKYSIKPEVVFTNPTVCNGKTVWKGAEDKDRVIKIAGKNTARITKYAFCRKGGFFDQMPVSAADGLVPIKNGRPTEIYGGYNKSTASFFVLVKYRIAKKTDVMVMPVELLYADKFLSDNAFAEEYAKRTVSEILNKPVVAIEFLLNKRIIKINTVLSFNGFKACITGKSSGGAKIGLCGLTPFKTSSETEAYVKRLESFENKKKKNANILFSEKFDAITSEENMALYELYIQKLKEAPYKYRPANPVETLLSLKGNFIALSPDQQAGVLLEIQGLFGRAKKADLTGISIKGGANTGETKLSSSISNWKKVYNDVRIIDQSASGLFEKISEVNLLELL